jgi:hypothetical protein
MVLAHQVASGQQPDRWVINPKAGVNFSDLILAEYAPAQAFSGGILGWNLGADCSYGKRWMARVGLHYFRLGNGVEMSRDTGLFVQRLSLSQVKIPFGAAYNLIQIDYLKLWVQAQGMATITTQLRENKVEAGPDQYAKTSLGGRLGVGIDLWRITLELNYEYGFTDLLNEVIFARNQMVSLALGFKI